MIYTCYDMIRDCRADRMEGWSYLVSQYVPVMRKLVAHYMPGRANDDQFLIEALKVLRQPESRLFESLEPSPERWFLAELRQRFLTFAIPGDAAAAEMEISLEVLTEALGPLTVVEKHAVWLETMGYAPQEAGVLLRMEPRTVEKIRDKAADRIRGQMDTWRRSLLADNGLGLGRAASAARTGECPAARVFLNVLDGRSTWQDRSDVERHVTTCWHCIDHFCRLTEVLDLLRGMTPLSEEEIDPFRAALGIAAPAPVWKRWFGA